MTDQAPVFNPEDYLRGKVRIPPSVRAKVDESSVYGDDLKIPNGQTKVITLAIDDGSHFLVEAVQILSGLQTNLQDLVTVMITESSSLRSWSNVPVPLRDLAGHGVAWRKLKYPNILRPASTISIQITNNSGTDAQFYVALAGRRIFDVTPAEADLLARRMFFQYVVQVAGIAATTFEQSFTVQVENYADFVICRLLGSQIWSAVIGAAAGPVSSELLMNLKNRTTTRSLFNKKLAARLLVGTFEGPTFVPGAGQSFVPCNPFELPAPWPLRRNTVVEAVFDNLANAATGAFSLTLEGFKIFDTPPVTAAPAQVVS